ncbi:MAG: protein kinase [Bryobacteraceae bacterium]|jgi:Tol biopolymer transport system component
MDSERFRQVDNLLQAALGRPEGERDAFLRHACAGDDALAREVRSLLSSQRQAGSFMESPAIEEAARDLAREPSDASEEPSYLPRGAAVSHYRPGQKLGDRYQLISKLGEGGMGEVWKARDTELDRDVAVKVSKSEFTARFKREARTIASFNHPNICQIYDVGPNYIVMELIDGIPLRGPLPVEKAVASAGFILDALDAAHRKGFTHRDLKPANVMVTAKGVVKLLDFGLAKQRVRELGPDDETGAALTKDGEITGTLQYMSPEQLNGKDADARSDIFAFGCVLYEMLSGRKAFSGSTTASVIAAIMEREPEPLQTTPPLDRVIRKCLMKDPDERFQTARDLKYNLGLAMESRSEVKAQAEGLLYKAWVAVAAVLGLLAITGFALYFRAAGTTTPETRVDIVTPAANAASSFALSPDGRRIAFVASGDGASRLWVRSLDSTSAQALPGTEGATSPFWSPDSRSLGFFSDRELKRIDLGGGQPQTLADVLGGAPQGAWSEEGVILFLQGASTPLSRVPASGGQVVAATKLGNGQTAHRAPRFLPGGRRFLFMSIGTPQALWLGSLDGGEPRRIATMTPGTDSAAEYLAPGWLVRVRQTVLTAQRFDAGSGQLSGDPVTLAQAVGVAQNTWAGSFSVSQSGMIAWRSGGGAGRRQLIWFNRAGQNAGTLGGLDESNLRYPELSPDGKRVAVTRGPVGSADIWIEEGTRISRFTFGQGTNLYPIWSPDGARVVFTSTPTGIYDLYQKPANGSGGEQVLLQSADTKRPNSWSPDGRFILYYSLLNNGDLMVLPLTGDRKPFPFLSTPFNEQQGAFSPDGKWVAYQSNESGRDEIYVRPFPGPGGQWHVSTGGGISPRWRADGKELYYVAPDDKLMAVPVAAQSVAQGAALAPGTPEALFQTQMPRIAFRPQYDVARDGRFLIDTGLPDSSAEPIHLLMNWRPPAN